MTTVKTKRKNEENEDATAPKKSLKKEEKTKSSKKPKSVTVHSKSTKQVTTNNKKNFNKTEKNKPVYDEKKPEDWNEFKKQKKELKLKRKQSKSLFEVMTKAKKMSEKIRLKNLPGGQNERENLIKELHSMLTGNYIKLVLTHDLARVVQCVVKHANQQIRNEICQEIAPGAVQILQSKYGRFCIKACLTYGSTSARSSIIKATYGNAVKLVSHAISAPVFEHAYSKYAQTQEKMHLIQEFFGDMYKQAKDNNVKHLRDIYKDSPDMKMAVLASTKSNLSRVLNKDLLDSGLVQSVLLQYLTECNNDDRLELILQLAPHAVILSNSKDGAWAVMHCFWNGTNKDKKVILKAIKQNVVEIAKHEHGHTCLISLLDSADDTVLLNKTLLTDISHNVLDLASNEWGRRVLLWIVAPGSSVHFHPNFIKDLQTGRDNSTCKKSPDIRQKEILDFTIDSLLDSIASNAKSWFANPSIAVVAIAILKAGKGENLQMALKNIADVIVDQNWKIEKNGISISGIEDAGLHMSLKTLCKNDKALSENTFGEILLEKLTDDVLNAWLVLNRGCFLLVSILENGSSSVQNKLKQQLKMHKKLLKRQESPGSKILLDKMKN